MTLELPSIQILVLESLLGNSNTISLSFLKGSALSKICLNFSLWLYSVSHLNFPCQAALHISILEHL